VFNKVFGHGGCLLGGEMHEGRRSSSIVLAGRHFRFPSSVIGRRSSSVRDEGAISVNIFDSKDSIRQSVNQSVSRSFGRSVSPTEEKCLTQNDARFR
jgi:hypothetical protein